jgi:hypothetical protein
MAGSATNTTVSKTCFVCSRDVSQIKRVRDDEGNYFCQACYDRLQSGETVEDILGDRCEACGYGLGTDAAQVDGHALCAKCAADERSRRQPATPAAEAVPVPDRPLVLHGLRQQTICPHCWHRFGPESALWISQHAELLGDPVVGPDAHARFLPSRFSPEGDAIDARGMRCHACACPRCHLPIPRPLFETEPLFTSIIGGPSSGKSYFLTSMTWQLRQQLPSMFGLNFSDVDAVANFMLNQNEERLFLQPDPSLLVNIEKTQTEGGLYDTIQLGQQTMSLPRPFMFNLQPLPGHPRNSSDGSTGRVLCMYDNAGEHFQPGRDTVAAPVTQHLAMAKVMIFLYDPTQDVRFRAKCTGVTNDPQMESLARVQRQETILNEAANRSRRLAGISERRKLQQPLLVVVPKLDAWRNLLDAPIETEPFIANAVENRWHAVDLDRVEEVSARLRVVLQHLTPEFVAVAESISDFVLYIPVSSLGHPPQRYPDRDGLGIRPADIKPIWVTVPFLYMFARWSSGLIFGARRRNHNHSPGS